MIVRILNFVVIGALIMAAAYVYRIKYDSTVQAERLAKIRSEVRRERDAIAALRAEWGELETPSRVEALAKRYLHLKPIVPTQFAKLDALRETQLWMINSARKKKAMPIKESDATIESTELPTNWQLPEFWAPFILCGEWA